MQRKKRTQKHSSKKVHFRKEREMKKFCFGVNNSGLEAERSEERRYFLKFSTEKAVVFLPSFFSSFPLLLHIDW